jgi:hypothetical protein
MEAELVAEYQFHAECAWIGNSALKPSTVSAAR